MVVTEQERMHVNPSMSDAPATLGALPDGPAAAGTAAEEDARGSREGAAAPAAASTAPGAAMTCLIWPAEQGGS